MKRAREDDSPILTLNVGGKLMVTTRHVLVNSCDYFPDSVLARMFRTENGVQRDAQGHHFIDADPLVFRHVLNVLRMPAQVADVPDGLSATAWCRALDYWGLVAAEDVVSVEAAQPVMTAAGSTLREIGRAIREEIVANEVLVIRTILEATGYAKQGGKTRNVELYVPIGHYRLPWGGDIGLFMQKEKKQLTRLLQDMLETQDINIYESRLGQSLAYSFGGESYTTAEPTMTLRISFPELDTLKSRCTLSSVQ